MAEGEWHRLIALLDDGDKFVRRKALKNLSVLDVDTVKVDFYLVVDAALRTACRDSVGSLREEAVTVLQRIVEKFSQVEPDKLSDVLKVVSERIEVDGCEEVRLQLVRLARCCVAKMSGCDDWMLSNLEPVTVFLKGALTDCYGEVAREGCECVAELAGSNPHFGLQSEFFVEPLLAGARNYGIKVRVSCIKALEPVLICSFLLIPNIVSRLEELYLEDNPQLRFAIVAMIGRVLVRLGVREQNCYLLLPFLFVAACDDFPQVSKSAENTLSELKAQENGATANSWCTYSEFENFLLLLHRLKR